MTAADAFQAGLDDLRASGFPADPGDEALDAARVAFGRKVARQAGKPAFAATDPGIARRAILEAYAAYDGKR